jgi:hypothetical protein
MLLPMQPGKDGKGHESPVDDELVKVAREAHSDAWSDGIPNAMSAGVYAAILLEHDGRKPATQAEESGQAGVTLCVGRICPSACQPEGAVSLSPSQACLREDLAREKVRWYGSWWYDHLLYMRLHNPLLSLKFSHPLHPISRRERWLLLVVQSFFTVLLACALTEATECVACGIYDCDISVNESLCVETNVEEVDTGRRVLLLGGGSGGAGGTGGGGGAAAPRLQAALDAMNGPRGLSRRQPAMGRQHHRLPSGFRPPQGKELPRETWCCASHRLGMNWLFGHTDEWWGVAIYSSVANLIFAQFTTLLVECRCAQRAHGGKFCGLGNHLVATELRARYEYLGYLVMALVIVVQAGLAVPLIAYIWKNGLGGLLLLNFVVGKVGSWSGITALQLGLFTAKFYMQRGRGSANKFHVTDGDYCAYIARTQAEYMRRCGSERVNLGMLTRVAQRARSFALRLHKQQPPGAEARQETTQSQQAGPSVEMPAKHAAGGAGGDGGDNGPDARP